MPQVDDAKIAELLDAKAKELQGAAPDEVPAVAPAAVETSASEAEGVADKAPAPEPTAKAAVAEEKAPDLSWMKAEYREEFQALPESMQKFLREARSDFARGADEKFQAAAALKKDAEKWRQLEKDESFRADVIAARKARTEKPAPAVKAAPKWSEAMTDEDFDNLLKDRLTDLVKPVIEERVTAEDRHIAAVNAAINDFGARVIEDYGVTEAVFKKAVDAWDADLIRQTNGKPYSVIVPEDVMKALPGYVRAAHFETQAEAKKQPTPAPLTAKAASIKGSGPGGPVQIVPAYKKEGRPPTAEEFWRSTVQGLGLSEEQLTGLRMGGSLTVQ